ncbi:hypothetical protein Pcinc_036004 [Petrolisthes cinctipes]|uniref:Ninjurin-2 n=1 Tax=Petrolisthes cinctipes TaxID=88211 RepID=A0AAE1BYL1_PETCI|nr:hypothetical protein Pcinc_036004 [Petrolisthes cinctipes]
MATNGYTYSGMAPIEGPALTSRQDLNTLKRNMTIAKGFLDISLLSANANQLRNVINYGNTDNNTYYVLVTGIILSLILQVAAGVLLIITERFDLNNEDDDEWNDRMNTAVVSIIFVVLIVNLFVSSFGVDVVHPYTTNNLVPHNNPPSHSSSGFIPSSNTGIQDVPSSGGIVTLHTT